ncbi:SP20H factor, partial [Crocuta crocuta]
MRESLERALERAEYVIASAQQRPPKRKGSSSGEGSLYEKLYDLYVEECGKEPEAAEELRSNVNLLEKLVRRESLPCLVVNLYPGKEGYSLMLEGGRGSYSETIRLPYKEGELLQYLDAEELPPALVDLLEKCQVNFFHSGCVVAQVRDYRQCSREPPGYESRHVLLRPTMQTLVCDVQSMASDHPTWTQEDRLLLESQLILATAEPLCLDPSVSVACTANRLLYNKQKMNTRPMKRSFQRYSARSLHLQEELSHRPLPPELRAWAACKKRRQSQAGQQHDLKISKAGNCVDMWKQRPCDLAVPSEVDVQKYARGKQSVRYNDLPPTAWPAHELEGDSVLGCQAGGETPSTQLTVMQPPKDPPLSRNRRACKEARCEGQGSRPHSSTDDPPDGVLPGSKTDAGTAVIRSEVLVQQKAKCPVTVSHRSGGSAGPSQPPPGKEPARPKMVWVCSSVLGKGVSRPPVRFRLSGSSGGTRPGNSSTPLEASGFFKSLPPAPKPPSLLQNSSMGANRVSTFPAAALSSASSSQRTMAPPVTAHPPGPNTIKVLGSLCAAQALAGASSRGQGSTTGATASAGTKPSSLPSGARPPDAVPAAPQAASPVLVPLLLKDASGLSSVTLLELLQGSPALNAQQQPRQRLFWLISGAGRQQASASGPQQPAPGGSGAQGSARPETASPAQQAVVFSLPGQGTSLQPQASGSAPRGCAADSQLRAGPSGPCHTLQPSPASQPGPPQQVQP